MTTDAATDSTTAPTAFEDASSEVGVELRYALASRPTPLPASSASGAYRLADLTIVLTRRSTDPIECGGITVTVPVGSGATALAAATIGMTAATDTPGWTGAVATSGQVTFTPPGGAAQIARQKGLSLLVRTLPVNRTVGRALLTVAVRWRLPGESTEDSWSTETVTLAISKFPATFSLGDLRASAGRIAHGDSVTLTWQAAGGDFQLLYDKADISVTGSESYTAHNITRDTLFQLRGTSSSSSGQLEAVRSTLVTVTNPDIVTHSLTVTKAVVTDRLATARYTVPSFSAPTLEHRPDLSMRIFNPLMRLWGAPTRLPFPPAASAPGLAVHGGKLHLLFRPYDKEQLTWATYDGRTWRTLSGFTDPVAPAPVSLIAAGTSLICAYRTPDGRQLTRTSTNGTTWGTASEMPPPGYGATSLCWDGTTLYAAVRTHSALPVLEVKSRTGQEPWQDFYSYGVLRPEIPIGSPELFFRNRTLMCLIRTLAGSVVSIRKDAEGVLTAHDEGMRSSHDVRLVTTGRGLFVLFPDSEGVLHSRSSDGTEPTPETPTAWTPAVPVDDYRTTETPALAWYRDRIIAIGRTSATRP
ncbi:hypothetical protein [Actinokineospora sp. NBRC 105648]|uniref:hypothetical protein n=1 Tax=Actinokineospora sp. NBRC 105648 TaxID=3032206 RepID=UPI0024A4E547|nr:hypothetical protein [Actinokineospora sp. NBRC 105648]GLZ37934.1 hypothetical protein Acsp05_15580 [Actinokineospora sp. NBRC 105648]